jgi:hypothetical protein
VPEAIQMGSEVVSSRVGPTGSYGQPPWLFRGLHCGKDFCRRFERGVYRIPVGARKRADGPPRQGLQASEGSSKGDSDDLPVPVSLADERVEFRATSGGGTFRPG